MTELAVDIAAFAARVADPGGTANAGKFYSKVVSGVTQEFFEASDGTVYQITPVASGAGVVPYSALTQALVVGTSNTLPNSTAVTSVFAAANDTITLAANTKYLMRGLFILERTVGAGSVFLSLGFAGAGAAASTCVYTAWTWYGSVYPFSTSPAVAFVTTTAASALTAAQTNQKRSTDIEGILTTTTAGAFTPQLTYSGVPGGVTTILPGSYLELIPLGANTFTEQGGWT